MIKAGAIIHSDQGSQYASNAFRRLLQQNCFRQSMSGKGSCYDNAQAEISFSPFKAELMEGGVLEDIEQARSEIFSYIEGYYNRVRLHSSLGYKSQMEFEVELKSKNGGNKRQFFVLKLDHLKEAGLFFCKVIEQKQRIFSHRWTRINADKKRMKQRNRFIRKSSCIYLCPSVAKNS